MTESLGYVTTLFVLKDLVMYVFVYFLVARLLSGRPVLFQPKHEDLHHDNSR